MWLIGSPCDTLPYNGKLPTLRECFKAFFKKLRDGTGTCSAQQAARETIVELAEIWEKAAIPTQALRDATEKLVSKYKKWRRLEKDAKLNNKKVQEKRKELEETLNRTFDIGHKNAQQLIEIKEDLLFYKSMLKDRKGFMKGIDRRWCQKQEQVLGTKTARSRW